MSLIDDKKLAAKLKREKQGPSELDVANQCDAMAVTMGWLIERYDQRRASGIHKGLPDRRYTKLAKAARVWVDHKAPGEKMSAEQADWMFAELVANGHAAPIDSMESFVALLRMYDGSSTGAAAGHRAGAPAGRVRGDERPRLPRRRRAKEPRIGRVRGPDLAGPRARRRHR